MKNKILKLVLFVLTIFIVFAEKNIKMVKKDEINKKEKEVILENEIKKGESEEEILLRQIKDINLEIEKSQIEYDKTEIEYREILKKIGVNNKNIDESIEKIKKSTEIININKEEVENKIKILDKIKKVERLKEKIGVSNSARQEKRSYDMKLLLEQQNNYIQVVEEIKKQEENEKEKEEKIKAQNEEEAQKISIVKSELENKSRELNIVKKEKEKLILNLREKEKEKFEKNEREKLRQKRKMETTVL